MSPKVKVLVADNDAQVRTLLSELLEELHHDVITCADGRAAIRRCEEEHPDLVLMDLQMPKMNGIESTSRLTAAHPDLRVLIVTQYDDENLRRGASAAGAQGYFLKDDLLQLQRYLSKLHERDGHTDTDE